jgi:hypothetical protein
VTTPTTTPEPAEPLARLTRLEDALVDLIAFTVDNNRERLARSIKAPTSGHNLERFLAVIGTERGQVSSKVAAL